MEPNERQNEILNYIRRDVIAANHSEEHRDEYEIKAWEVSFWENGTVWLRVVTGRKNDEHTMASVFCRDYRYITITRRGAVALHNAVDKRTSKAKGDMHLRPKRSAVRGYWKAVRGWTCS